uniref:RNA-binding protein 19 n=1 Tax=Hirondellea gigas TaxID=1518452 RepID=A0A2P2I0F9_9CRUS
MSRIFIKNLPKNTTEQFLREKFKETGTITDIKLVYRNGAFLQYAFMGFEHNEQACKAQKIFNNNYFYNSKVSVELARDFNDKSGPKSIREQKAQEKLVAQKREDSKQLRLQLSRLRRTKNDESKTTELLKQYKNDPKFQHFIALKTGKNLLDKTDTKEETTQIKNDQTTEDEELKENKDSLANKEELSDILYWQSLMQGSPESEQEEPEKEDPEHTTSKKKKKKEWVVMPTVCLRINKFPKRSGTKDKKKKDLSKQDVKEFFKPLSFKTIRKNAKNRFEFFIGFATEKIANEALKKNASFLLGVKVHLTMKSGSNTTAAQAKSSAPWAEAAAKLERCESVAESGKIFLRNLSFSVSEETLKEELEEYGEISEFELPVCKMTRKVKGFATATFLRPECAVLAMNALDGKSFMGRLMHVLPGLPKEQTENPRAKTSSFKEGKLQEQKDPSTWWQSWNTLHIAPASVLTIMAQRYKKTKEEILSTTGDQSAGVTLALGETQIVDETRRFLEEHDVSVEGLTDPNVERSYRVMLIKNLPADTKASDIAELCGKWGELGRVVMPPSGTTCIVEFLSATEGHKAYLNLHSRKWGHSPVFLEKAPVKIFKSEFKKPVQQNPEDEEEEEEEEEEENEQIGEKRKRAESDEDSSSESSPKKKKKVNKKQEVEPEAHTTIYVKNLPLEVTEKEITEHFSTAGTVYNVILARKGEASRGYGFVQFVKQREARTALTSLENSTLGGRNISLKLSEKKLDKTVKAARKVQDFGKQTSSKLSVKNIPFQCTKIEIEQLFRPFGALKRVFLQKHHSGQFSNGGYGFVEYLNVEDAKRALTSMGLSTHFHGRRLVLQWAKDDESVDELREKTAHKYSIAQSLGTGHKKMRHAMREEGATRGDE